MSTKLPRLSSKHAKSVKCKVNLCNLARNYFANVTSLSKKIAIIGMTKIPVYLTTLSC